MNNTKYTAPMDIERRSMEIIEEQLGDIKMPEREKKILKRVIHTTADFDYVKNLRFSENAVEAALDALRNGAHIVTDTTMAMAGINKRALAALGGDVRCYVADPEVAAEAESKGITRSRAAVDHAFSQGGDIIYAVGNAPTALIRLNELIEQGKAAPKLVIAVPVGFVNVVEAKELIVKSGVEYIAAMGRKGGSNVAAAICNALLYMIKRG